MQGDKLAFRTIWKVKVIEGILCSLGINDYLEYHVDFVFCPLVFIPPSFIPPSPSWSILIDIIITYLPESTAICLPAPSSPFWEIFGKQEHEANPLPFAFSPSVSARPLSSSSQSSLSCSQQYHHRIICNHCVMHLRKLNGSLRQHSAMLSSPLQSSSSLSSGKPLEDPPNGRPLVMWF